MAKAKSLTSTIVALLASAAMSPSAQAEGAGGAALVDALNGVFGKHKARASHAKGQCISGTFTPAPDAAKFSKAEHFKKAVPIIGRFSMGGGNPKIADNAKPAPRGLAVRFDLGGGKNSDLVLISAPIFFAKTPDQFAGFLQARVPGPEGKPDPEKVKAFAEKNPETAKQGAWIASQPIPASYVGTNYWAVHAFTLSSDDKTSTVVKFKAVPAAPIAGLSDDEAKAKPADFYVEDLKMRLAAGPVAYDLMAILGEAGDPTSDPTVMWPEDARKSVKLGSIAFAKLADDGSCDGVTFDPANLNDGIAGPADDAIFAARSAAYAASLSRRSN